MRTLFRSRLHPDVYDDDPPPSGPILWVDKDHVNASDATTRENNSESMPWASIHRATWGNSDRDGSANPSEAAAAGDTVYVKKATTPYLFTWAPADESLGPYTRCANGGSSGNPIIIQGYGFTLGEDYVEIRSTGSGNANVLGTMGASGSQPGTVAHGYIQFRGFLVDENETATNGWTCDFTRCRDVLVEYCKLVGDGPTTTRADNHNATRFTHVLNGTVRNCWLEGYYPNSSGNDNNGNACEVYWSTGIVFEHNYVTDCSMSAYWKAPNHEESAGTTDGWTTAPHYIRFNHFHDCAQGVGIHRLNDVDEANGVYVYQNLFTDIRETLFRLHAFSGDECPKHVKIVNNTFYGTGSTIPEFEVFTLAPGASALSPALGVVIRNNIIALEKTGIEGVNTGHTTNNDFDGDANWQSDRNSWSLPTASSGNFFIGGSGNLTYANWRALPGGSNLLDQNSSTEPVTFIDADNGDFRLENTGQAALTLGRAIYGIGGADDTVIPAGAYITGNEVIGVEPV